VKAPCDIPVAVFLYRRVDELRGLFNRIKVVMPKKVYLVADGPTGPGAEEKKCKKARKVAEEGINWPCEVVKLYSANNLGLQARLESGLDYIFNQEDYVVVLEDDCWPDPQFFEFTHFIHQRFSKTPDLGWVSGSCFLPRTTPVKDDYFFSRYAHCWGWATWAVRWKQYRQTGWRWPKEGYQAYDPDASRSECAYWNRIFAGLLKGKYRSWAYAWQAFFWQARLAAICPTKNLVTNVGFGPGGTNMKEGQVDPGVERLGPLEFPLKGAIHVRRNPDFDRQVFRNHFLRMSGRRGIWQKICDRYLGAFA
jgi:hypothetical protein